ncbi:hypothetical protein JZ751_020896 [Albula glossodonta]|uniref:TAFH domain-containing protein n=1 Tax=Albula glossodonta TaxID=121402 RepID=A0A8T2PN67_9TELE|nr:hypothetical protein JZ751_020896 [Albula glossodonta]
MNKTIERVNQGIKQEEVKRAEKRTGGKSDEVKEEELIRRKKKKRQSCWFWSADQPLRRPTFTTPPPPASPTQTAVPSRLRVIDSHGTVPHTDPVCPLCARVTGRDTRPCAPGKAVPPDCGHGEACLVWSLLGGPLTGSWKQLCHYDRQGQIQLHLSLTIKWLSVVQLKGWGGMTGDRRSRVWMGGSIEQKVGTMPDSPADVKTQPRSTPPTMPPPPPAVSQATNRSASFTPTTMLNGSSHSPTALNGAPSTPNGFSNGPAMSSSASLSTQQLPPACGARQLCKLKRFLTTLQQFGNDISPEIGEPIVSAHCDYNSTLTIEEFHSKLQEATNFPLRPFVIPFLKANLPLLQRELLHCARMAKQTPAQYLAQHEQLLLDANASSPLDSSEILLEISEHSKRKTPDSRGVECELSKRCGKRTGVGTSHVTEGPPTQHNLTPESPQFSPFFLLISGMIKCLPLKHQAVVQG